MKHTTFVYNNHLATSSIGKSVHPAAPPKSISSQHSFFLGDENLPTCVFSASFDSMGAYEEQQNDYKETTTIEHHISRISLTRSDSHNSMSDEDYYDVELMMSYTSLDAFRLPPPELPPTTTKIGRSSSRTISSSPADRPSDPVARFLLSK